MLAPLLLARGLAAVQVDPMARCDLQACHCDGYDLSHARGQVLSTAAGANGWVFLFSLCTPIPREAIPRGCKDFSEHPAALRFKPDEPDDCVQVGSVGPCFDDGPCGMFGTFDLGAGPEDEKLMLEYRYPFGCNNTFAVELTKGEEPRPTSAVQATEAGCDYHLKWPSLPLQSAPELPEPYPVPTVKVAEDDEGEDVLLPMLALGTGSGQKADRTETGVSGATRLWLTEAGGTAIDTAYGYGDQEEIAEGIADAVVENFGSVPNIFLETKIPCSDFATAKSNLNSNLDQLGVSTVDLTLMHFKCKSSDDTAATWEAMEDFQAAGGSRSIGVSNFDVEDLRTLAETAEITPAVNQRKLSIVSHDAENVAYCKKAGITYQAYSPLCGGFNGSSCSHGGAKNVMTVPAVVKIAASRGKSPAQIGLKWIVQQGIPLTTAIWDLEYMQQDLDLWSWGDLTAAEMQELTAVGSPPPAPGSPAAGDGGQTWVVVLVAALVLAAAVAGGAFWLRRKRSGGEERLLQDHLDGQLDADGGGDGDGGVSTGTAASGAQAGSE